MSDSRVFLIENSKSVTRRDIAKLASEIRNLFGSRKLIAVEAANTIEITGLILAVIMSGNVALLFDKNLNQASRKNLIEQYSPEICFFNLRDESFESYNAGTIEDFNFIARKDLDKQKDLIHPENCLLLPTSGSTGSPRYVRISYNNLKSQAEAIGLYLNINASSRTITSLPTHYSFGFSILNSYLFNHGQIVMSNKSAIEHKYWDTFSDNHITSLSGVPFSFDLWKKSGFLARKFPNLNTLTQAGGHMNKDIKAEFLDYCEGNRIDFYVMYGQTEATARMSFVPPGMLKNKLESAGVPISHGRIEIRNLQSGNLCRQWEIGEVIYRGPNVSLGIAENRNDLSDEDRFKGILTTGDLGFLDDDAYLHIVGRSKRIAKVFGYRVNLDELERELQKCNGEVACIEHNNKIKVFISRLEILTCLKRIIYEEKKLPRSSVEILLLKEIPRLASGKIFYENLINSECQVIR